ncbi:MAG: hypothetical protein HPY64_17650 [Anaerolineae bacterium]|nr:hypothetical protein [Anaerolineae bacterium]
MKAHTLKMLLVLLLIAAGLRAWNLDTQSIWFDEGYSWYAASRPTLLQTVAGDLTNPPLYYLLLHIWIRLIGDSEFGLRSLSLLQGVLLLAVMGMAARRWFGPGAATLVVALGTFTPLLWWASQEARMYNTLALAVLCAMIGLSDILTAEQPSHQSWWLLLGGETAALYTHNTGVVVLGAVNLLAGVWWLGALFRRRWTWRWLRRWLITQGIVLLIWVPELVGRFSTLGSANAATRTPPDLTPALLWQAWQGLWASSWEMVRANPAVLNLISLVTVPLLVISLAGLRTCAGRMVWAAILALWGVLVAALSVLGVNYHGRYSVMIAPLFLIAVAAGVTGFTHQARIRSVFGAAAVFLTAVTWFALPGRPDPAYQHDQAREMVAYYRQTLGPDDLVLTWSYAARYELLYYQQRHGLPAQIITLPDGAEADNVIDILNRHLPPGQSVRVEINTWYTQGSDRRGMLRCLIGHNHPAPGHTMVVQGMASTAYEVTGPLTIPSPQAITPVQFDTVTLLAAGLTGEIQPASHGICIPLEVTLNAPVKDDLQAAVRLLNAQGREVAAADAPILSAQQAGTRYLRPGESALVYPLLYLPQGTPPGAYRVTVRLYGADAPSGLDIRDPASGAPAGKDAEIGLVRVIDGNWPPFPAGCALSIAPGLLLTNCAELAPAEFLHPGQTLPLTLAWQIDGEPPPITVSLTGSDWHIEDTATPLASGAVLDWREMVIPAQAAGRAILKARAAGQEPVTLAEYTIVTGDHVMSPPAVAYRSGVHFAGLGTLYGFTIEEEMIFNGSPVTITLVWQAETATQTAYVVTVQLLDVHGILIAQHDSPPVAGERPTTGWVAGEYISDTHRLVFRDDRRDYTGPASLIVAVYDPATGARIAADGGATEAVLLSSLTVSSR